MTDDEYAPHGTTWNKPHDREHEEEMAARLGKAWGMEPIRLPEFCPVDYFIGRAGRPFGLAEFKWRKCESGTYPDFIIDLSKAITLVQWGRWLGLNPVIVVRYADALMYAIADDLSGTSVRIGGRIGERPDALLVIPHDHFRPVAES